MENNVRAVLEELNEEQRKAVQCLEGPVLIVAGAGSGKTRVLTSRVANLLAHGCDPSRVLALTFTKKAAGEMKERIALMVGYQRARKVVMGTFHSIFVRFLREYASVLGYPEQFTIYDQSDSTSAVKTVIKELGLDDAVYKPRDVLARISAAKNNLITVSAYKTNAEALKSDSYAKKPRLVDVYERYQQRLKQSGVMDFDDILVNMNILLRDSREALEDISSRFSHIMVDEYQDTNLAQYIIVRKLAEKHRNVCVVGDDSQSIYAFRGARIQNILNFKKDYPECRVFRLERNYRSTRNIVEAANSVIEHNAGRIPKKCYAEGDSGEKLHVIKAYTEQDEAAEIVYSIQDRIRSEGAKYEDFALLYRTNAQSRALEEQLRRRNIPYMIYSGNSFFERAEVKDMMAYFKLAVNPADDESFKRVVNKPARAIGDTTLKALEAAAVRLKVPLFHLALNASPAETGLRDATVQKVKAFCAMIDGFSQRVGNTDAYELARRIADDSGLYAFYKSDNSIEGQARTANVEELINSVKQFVEEREEEAEGAEDVFTLDDYLENVSLLTNVDTTGDEDTNNKVALMTAHSAKGLEFPYVYVSGLEENLFPSQSLQSSGREIEEERRLFYVAMTRAKKVLTLSFAGTRMRNGRHESNPPSRFISEIESRYLDKPLAGDSVTNSSYRQGWGNSERRWGSGNNDRSRLLSGGFSGGSGSPKTGVAGATRRPATMNEGAGPLKHPWVGQRPPYGSSTGSTGKPSTPLKPVDPDFVALPMTAFRPGMRIEHNRFGFGEILEITGSVPELKARVRFDELGEKLLLLKYAKMRLEKKA